MKSIAALCLSLAFFNSAACVEPAPDDAPAPTSAAAATTPSDRVIPMRLVSRRIGTTASQARVVVGNRVLDQSMRWGSTGSTFEVREGSAVVFRVTRDPDGTTRMADKQGRLHLVTEAANNPALADAFDGESLLLTFPSVLKLTAGIDPQSAVPVAPIGVGLYIAACFSGSTLDAGSDGWELHIQFDCPFP